MSSHSPSVDLNREKLDINVTFYTLIKKLNGSDQKLSDSQINALLETLYQSQKLNKVLRFDILINKLSEVVVGQKNDLIKDLFTTLSIDENFFVILEYALQLLLIKPHLLSEAKLGFDVAISEEKAKHHQLSLEYDKISSYQPYYLRVSGALLSLIFFDQLEKNDPRFLSSIMQNFAAKVQENHKKLSQHGLEANQIFSIMFSEVINQSIVSSAGSSFEDRIKELLISIGIPKESIHKAHDRNDTSTEYDFVFEYKNKSIGIGAKRTLRERYKQFTNTSKELDIDLMIEITLGTDLTSNRVNTITENFNVVLIIADEIYNYPSNAYLRDNNRVFKATSLNTELFDNLL